jgi:hypothetical protein
MSPKAASSAASAAPDYESSATKKPGSARLLFVTKQIV